jgi:PAS domain S-box-containing protein
VNDVSERRRAEQDVRRSREELQTLLDSMSTMVATVATDGRLLLVNRMAEAASGLSRAELMRTPFLEGPWWSFDPAVQSRVRKAFRRACEGTPVSYDEQIRVFGQVLTISFGLTPVTDPDGRVAYLVAEGRDVTLLKAAEQGLRERSLELEALNHDLEAFTYSVSHDLRAPLRHVAGFARILEEDYGAGLDEKAGGHLRRIVEGARHMGELIDDLLKLSRLGRRPLEREPCELGVLVEEARHEVAAESPERPIEWRIGRLPRVECDRGLVRQVFVNLLANAVKYSRPRPRSEVEVGAMQQGGATVFYVRDNGVGFDMKYAHKLFGVFQRLHGVAHFEGSGIGLATVQRIVHKHGGRAWAQAAVDQGATFYFTLEPARDDAQEPSPVAASEGGGGDARRG